MSKTRSGVAMIRVFMSVGLIFTYSGFVAALDKDNDVGLAKQAVAVAKTEAEFAKQASSAVPGSQEQQQLLQKRDQARQQTNTLINSCPTCPVLLTVGSDIALNRGDTKEAASLADQAVSAADLAPTPNPTKLMGALDQRGLVSLKTGDYQKAMDDARRVLTMAPSNPMAQAIYRDAKAQLDAQASSARASSSAKRIASALDEPQLSPGGFHASANSADPRFQATAQNIAAVAHLKDAKHFLDMGDGQGALSAAAAAESASPAFAADTRVMQAQAWAVLQDLTKALAQISEAIRLFAQQGRRSDLASAFSQRAQFQNDLKNPIGAVEDSSSALEADPKLASAYFERARGNEALGKAELAAADIDRAAALDPGFMADRDEFHKRHRAQATEGETLAGRIGALGPLNAGVALAGVLLLALAGGVAWMFRRRSPVGFHTMQSAATPVAPGGLIGRSIGGGEYKIVQQIGEGGMGTVYEAEDAKLGRLVAVKCLRPELESMPRERERFVKEARTVAVLHHPHIVQIHTILHEQGSTFIVYEHLEGRTLHEELNASPGRHLEPKRGLEILRQMALALDHAHSRNIIHRDLKPANVMLTEVGGKDWIKVMDFGIARQVQDILSITVTNTIVGTPHYMSPEQALGVVGRSSDVFALGVMFYEILTGALPFKGGDMALKAEDRPGRFLPPSNLLPGLPFAIDAVIERTLLADTAKRPKTCMEFYAEAAAALRIAAPT